MWSSSNRSPQVSRRNLLTVIICCRQGWCINAVECNESFQRGDTFIPLNALVHSTLVGNLRLWYHNFYKHGSSLTRDQWDNRKKGGRYVRLPSGQILLLFIQIPLRIQSNFKFCTTINSTNRTRGTDAPSLAVWHSRRLTDTYKDWIQDSLGEAPAFEWLACVVYQGRISLECLTRGDLSWVWKLSLAPKNPSLFFYV